MYLKDDQMNFKIMSGVESRNSERAFNYALEFADKMFFQGLYIF